MDGGSNLGKAIAAGEFVVTAEYRPPRGTSVERLLAAAESLAPRVHAVCAPESEDGARMCSMAACRHLAAAGAEPILHLLTRDMNRISLQATILGAASLGVRNVLCLAGRHQALTTCREARGVFDVDAIQLLRIADRMRRDGRLADEEALDSPVDLLLGTDTNPFSDPVDLQILTLDKAVRMGADFVITQPVFNLRRFDEWLDGVRERGVHTRTCVVASVMPLVSKEQASSLLDSHRQLDIPDEVIARLETASDSRATGVELAAATVSHLRSLEGVRGVHISAGEDFDLATDVLTASGLAKG